MNVFVGLFIILAFLVIGNILSALLGGFMPGSFIGAVIESAILKLFRMKSPIAKGLAIALTGVMTAVVVPLFNLVVGL